MEMKRAYRYRFYPKPKQAEIAGQVLCCVRFVYDSILRSGVRWFLPGPEENGLHTSQKICWTFARAGGSFSAPLTVTAPQSDFNEKQVVCFKARYRPRIIRAFLRTGIFALCNPFMPGVCVPWPGVGGLRDRHRGRLCSWR
ncbi:helix-turn-helix domain-containing protein [Azotobacter chroococcum]|uniref:helix-turn-helix domain-containing protein n=1 Tax=Azotobacter chroococcum TaxID=353 RepID=UPI0009E1DF8B